MKHYQELSSTKYWLETVEQQNRELRRHNNRSNLKALAHGAVGISFLLISILTMPVWVSAMVELLDYLS